MCRRWGGGMKAHTATEHQGAPVGGVHFELARLDQQHLLYSLALTKNALARLELIAPATSQCRHTSVRLAILSGSNRGACSSGRK